MVVFDRLTLSDDLVDCRGRVLAPRGTVISPQSIAEAAGDAPPLPRRALGETAVAADVGAALEVRAYRPLFGQDGAREAVERTLLAVELPERLVDELLATRQDHPTLYRHGILTAAVGVRVLHAAVSQARVLSDLAAAALLHDLGMRHMPARLLAHRERLSADQVHRIATHPLLGAYHLATVMGHHPAVAAAQCHHWRCGQGYPGLTAAPSRSVEVIAVASAFCALTQPRPYRSSAFDMRGAADVLVQEASAGHADANTVRLLVHALRGGTGDPRGVRFGGSRDGHAPEENNHNRVEVPARSHV
jgi:hypothetical protein